MLSLNHGQKSAINIRIFYEVSCFNFIRGRNRYRQCIYLVELRQINLGNKFYNKVEESIQLISGNPYSSKTIYKGIRRFIIKKFPYGIYYNVIPELKEIPVMGFKTIDRINKWRRVGQLLII